MWAASVNRFSVHGCFCKCSMSIKPLKQTTGFLLASVVSVRASLLLVRVMSVRALVPHGAPSYQPFVDRICC